MDQTLRPHQQYAVAYLDNIIVNNETWEEHVTWVEAIPQALWEAGLTAKPTKCRLVMEQVNYLGHVVGQGCI